MLALLSAAHASEGHHDDGLRILAIGDWGGVGNSPYTTPGEVDNAHSMGQVASQYNVSTVWALGDNFYMKGIPGDEHDPRFKETYEDVFTADSLQVPWWVIGGNHDHYGNLTAQIEYTKHSKRWNFPTNWYSQFWTFKDGGKDFVVQVVMIDTVVLAGPSYEVDEMPFDPITGEYINVDESKINHEVADAQWDWIETTLKSSTADFLLVAGHYPIYSICMHGSTQKLVDNLLPLMRSVNATGYLCGHDHCMEHLEDQGTPFILTGAGHDCCYDPKNLDKVPEGSVLFRLDSTTRRTVHEGHTAASGFVLLDFTADGMKTTYYDDSAYPMYKTRTFPPRDMA